MDEITKPAAAETNPAKAEPKAPRSETWLKKHKAIWAARTANGLDDATFHELLEGLVGVSSTKDLTEAQQADVLDYFNGKRRSYPGRPHNMDCPDRGPMLRKIEALLADSKLPWAYADGISKRMFKVERVAFCAPEQLRKIIQALAYSAQRRTPKSA